MLGKSLMSKLASKTGTIAASSAATRTGNLPFVAAPSKVTIQKEPYDILEGSKFRGADRIPIAPKNPYRKRPLKL